MTNAFREYQKSARNDKSGFFICRDIYWKITGRDKDAGTLLSKLAHIFSTLGLTYERNGKQWRAYTREQWHEEIWLSRKSLDRAMAILKHLRLIEVKVMRYKYHGQTMLHIHLDEEELSQRIDQNVQVDLPKTNKSHSPKGAIVKDQQYGTAVEDSGSCVAPSAYAEPTKHQGTTQKGQIGKNKPKEKEKVALKEKENAGVKKVTDLKNLCGEQYGESFSPKNASQLGSFWMYLVQLHHNVELVDGLTPKQYGQLKNIMDAATVMQSKYPMAPPLASVFRWVVRYWHVFAELVEENTAEPIGSTPHIGALLKHLGVAMNGMNSKKAKEWQSIAKKKKVQTTI